MTNTGKVWPQSAQGIPAVHVQLRDSLLAWYRAIDSLEPGRVRFGLPDDGLPARMLALGPRAERSGAALFDRLLSLLR
jgi:hypothetical protein